MKKIINKIFHRIKEETLTKKSGTADRKKEYNEIKSVKTCLVYWVADENQAIWLKMLNDRLGSAKIDKLCFIPENVEILVTDETVAVKNVDLGFGGKIQNDNLLRLMEKEYDLLIDLSMVNNVLADYVLRNSVAKCKVGMKREGFEADIVIDGVAGQTEFIEKMFEFLAGVRKY